MIGSPSTRASQLITKMQGLHTDDGSARTQLSACTFLHYGNIRKHAVAAALIKMSILNDDFPIPLRPSFAGTCANAAKIGNACAFHLNSSRGLPHWSNLGGVNLCVGLFRDFKIWSVHYALQAIDLYLAKLILEAKSAASRASKKRKLPKRKKMCIETHK